MTETDLFIHFLNNADGIKYYTESDRLWIQSFFHDPKLKFHSFESPDVVIETSSKFILLEHFQFDSSARKKGSSLLKEEEALKDREYNSRINYRQTKENVTEISYHTSFETDLSLENYKNNLIESFEKHIKKYKDYIHHFMSEIKNLDKDIEFGLIIQNTSILPDVVYKDSKMVPLTPYHISEFRNKLKQFPQVRHIFFLMDNVNKKTIFYFNFDSINEIESKIPKINGNYKFIPWKPRSIMNHVEISIKKRDE
jgi:hypothetical protein